MNQYRKTWELYSESWKRTKLSERIELFKKSLSADCCYTDPLVLTKGWDELVVYMEQFHSQVPGGHFEIVDFQAHHNFSIARWNMLNHENMNIGDGYSFGEYNQEGLLIKMTGFYKT